MRDFIENKIYLFFAFLINSLFLLLGVKILMLWWKGENYLLSKFSFFAFSLSICFILISLMSFIHINLIFKRKNSLKKIDDNNLTARDMKFNQSMKVLYLLIKIFIIIFLVSLILGFVI